MQATISSACGIEPYSRALWDEFMPIARRHFEEVGGGGCFSPNRDLFEALSASGMLRVFAYRVEGRLIGYLVATVSRGVWTTDLQATEEGFYVEPDSRGIGRELLAFAIRCLKSEGVIHLIMHSTVANDYSPLLERMGFKKLHTAWSMNLAEV